MKITNGKNGTISFLSMRHSNVTQVPQSFSSYMKNVYPNEIFHVPLKKLSGVWRQLFVLSLILAGNSCIISSFISVKSD